MARRRDARISFENSGVIRSLGELTPNITLPPNRYYTVSPVVITPLRFITLSAPQTVVEIETVNVERYSLCHICAMFIN